MFCGCCDCCGGEEEQSYGWNPPSNCSSTFCWMQGNPYNIPPNAVLAGRDKDGAPLYAGRAFHEGDLIPAKVAPHLGTAFVPYGGEENAKSEFEILTSTGVAWQSGKDGQVPSEAIAVGRTQDGEQLFMGRTFHDGTMTPGKIQPSHGCLYISYAGQEISFTEYEVLVLT